jgi:hypothetical protein
MILHLYTPQNLGYTAEFTAKIPPSALKFTYISYVGKGKMAAKGGRARREATDCAVVGGVGRRYPERVEATK